MSVKLKNLCLFGLFVCILAETDAFNRHRRSMEQQDVEFLQDEHHDIPASNVIREKRHYREPNRKRHNHPTWKDIEPLTRGIFNTPSDIANNRPQSRMANNNKPHNDNAQNTMLNDLTHSRTPRFVRNTFVPNGDQLNNYYYPQQQNAIQNLPQQQLSPDSLSYYIVCFTAPSYQYLQPWYQPMIPQFMPNSLSNNLLPDRRNYRPPISPPFNPTTTNNRVNVTLDSRFKEDDIKPNINPDDYYNTPTGISLKPVKPLRDPTIAAPSVDHIQGSKDSVDANIPESVGYENNYIAQAFRPNYQPSIIQPPFAPMYPSPVNYPQYVPPFYPKTYVPDYQLVYPDNPDYFFDDSTATCGRAKQICCNGRLFRQKSLQNCFRSLNCQVSFRTNPCVNLNRN